MALTFEWDAANAIANLGEHGVSFDEAVSIFADSLGRLEYDDRHSVSEHRLVLLGGSSADRLLPSCFTERGPERIRLISARKATRSERRQYEERPQVKNPPTPVALLRTRFALSTISRTRGRTRTPRGFRPASSSWPSMPMSPKHSPTQLPSMTLSAH